MSNPWDAGPPDTPRNRFIGGAFVVVATVLLYLWLSSGAPAQDGDHPAPTTTVSR